MLHSTDEFSASSFRPHGRIESDVEDRIFIQKAKGPFNEQIISAMRVVHKKALDSLVNTGPWGAIFHIEENALSSFPMFKSLTDYLSSQAKNGSASVGTAIVIGDDVDGASMMAAHYLKAWSDAGIRCRHFANFDDGKSWIQNLLLQIADGKEPFNSGVRS
jgi:hypothetical protein